MLLPLPAAAEMESAPALGSVIDEARFHAQLTERLSFSHAVEGADTHAAKLVGARLDPCFRLEFKDVCRAQLRLVWQPIEQDAAGKTVAVDAAVHTFHDFTPRDFTRALADLRRLNLPYRAMLATPGTGIQPVLARDGWDSEYGARFKTFLADNLRRSRLSRVAVMTLHAFDSAWELFAKDVSPNGVFADVAVPRERRPYQRFENLLQRPREMLKEMADFGGMNPAKESYMRIGAQKPWTDLADEPAGFLMLTAIAADLADTTEVVRYIKDSAAYPPESGPALRRRVAEILDPRRELPGTVDCVSCHAAPSVSRYLDGSTEIHAFRAFGYFKDQPVISPRVVSETAAIVTRLNHSADPH